MNDDDIVYNLDKEELDILSRGINIPVLAPLCYERAYTINKSYVIKLLGQYIISSKDIDGFDYKQSLKYLIRTEWVLKEFNICKFHFLNQTLVSLIKTYPAWFREAEEIDLVFRIPSIDAIANLDEILESLPLNERVVSFQINKKCEMSSSIDNKDDFLMVCKNYIDHYLSKNRNSFRQRFGKMEEFWMKEIVGDPRVGRQTEEVSGYDLTHAKDLKDFM